MPDDITPALLPPGRLAEIERREKAATPGPWTYHEPEDPDSSDKYAREGRIEGPNSLPIPDTICYEPPDCRFIAHSRADVPALLAHLYAQDDIIHDLQLDSLALAAGERRERERVLAIVEKHRAEWETPYGSDTDAVSVLGALAALRDAIGQPTTGPALPADLREENARLRRALGEVAEMPNAFEATPAITIGRAKKIAREALKGNAS